VVFSAESGDNVDVFTVDDETGAPQRLTTASGRDFAPAWSPNKKQIAFLSDRNGTPTLWLMDSGGDSKSQVSQTGLTITGFRWAPDSKRIGIEVVEDNSRRIEVIEIESGESILLTPRSEDVRIGDWSPDGQWLVYAAIKGDDRGIRRRNPTGVDEIVVTTGPDLDPRWSPNGDWIAFSRESDDGTHALVIIGEEGGKTTNLSLEKSGETTYDWAPDSKRIVFVSESSGNAEIYIVTPDGKDSEQLTSNRVADTAPRWNKKGSSILFLSEGDGSYDIYSMNKDGEQQVRMTTIADLILEADW
jgi:TolB protein